MCNSTILEHWLGDCNLISYIFQFHRNISRHFWNENMTRAYLSCYRVFSVHVVASSSPVAIVLVVIYSNSKRNAFFSPNKEKLFHFDRFSEIILQFRKNVWNARNTWNSNVNHRQSINISFHVFVYIVCMHKITCNELNSWKLLEFFRLIQTGN